MTKLELITINDVLNNLKLSKLSRDSKSTLMLAKLKCSKVVSEIRNDIESLKESTKPTDYDNSQEMQQVWQTELNSVIDKLFKETCNIDLHVLSEEEVFDLIDSNEDLTMVASEKLLTNLIK